MTDSNSSSSSLPAAIEADLRRIVAELEQLTGLLSLWNQRVEVVLETSAAFGGKTFSCLIRIRADIAASDLRWPTLLHEAFHCFSVERSPDASLNFTGYEEGVVEQLQRLYRQELLDTLGVNIQPDAFVDRDANNAYTHYIDSLEGIRRAIGEEAKPFYLRLLGTPLEQRWALLRTLGQEIPEWSNAAFRRRWKRWESILQGEDY